MIGTKLHWVDGPWPGKLALSARPRGGDWLPDEMASWQSSGIGTVVSLLTESEATEFELGSEALEARRHQMEFRSFAIADRQVPDARATFQRLLEDLDGELTAGGHVVLHCRQGLGRTGLLAACLLVAKGLDPAAAIERLRLARGATVPETAEQLRWIEDYAASLAVAR